MVDERAAQRTTLLVATNARAYAIPLANVEETMRPLPLTPVRGMPSFVAGLSLIRGAAVPVVDVAKLTGDDSGGPPERFVSMRVEERRLALAVGRVLGARRLSESTLEGLPTLLSGATDVVESVGAVDDRFLFVLRSTRILTAELWAALDAQAETR
jgi:purine-binding chemotaxis protein CheW